MKFDWRIAKRLIGIAGTIGCVALFVRQPSFPTPDKLLIFITFVFMSFGQGWAVFKRLAPFVMLLLVYESFRGLVPSLNNHVNFMWMPAMDKLLFFGHLPTAVLQQWWWPGYVRWYDFVFYGAYMLHFVLPVALALIIWKFRESEYWRYVTTFVLVSFAGFITFLLFPAAPPWMASQKGLIEPVVRVSSHVYAAFGIHDFPSLYNKISPNPVAAVPSLHAAYATLFALFITILFRPTNKSKRFSWAGLRWLAWLHPLLIWVGTVYQGEHYAIDELLGIIYALAAYFAAPYVLQFIKFSYGQGSDFIKSQYGTIRSPKH